MSNIEKIISDSIRLIVKNPVFEEVDITNIFGTPITVLEGSVLSFDATTGKYNATYSAIPALANAKAVSMGTVSFDTAETKRVTILTKGQVNEEILLFQPGDDLDTIPPGGSDSFRTQLRDYGIITVPESFQDEIDN